MSLARERFWLIVFVSKTDFEKCGVHDGPFSKTFAGKPGMTKYCRIVYRTARADTLP